jgi:hypothetical protein
MKGNLGKENAWRKGKMEEFKKNFPWPYPPQFAMQTPCRTGLGRTLFCDKTTRINMVSATGI